MRKDFGIYLYSALLLTLVFYFLADHKGYATYVSDWRNKPCHYATNAVACNYYNGCNSKWLRKQSANEINQRLARGDTLYFGIDYYALYPISLVRVQEPELVERLKKGEVFIEQVYNRR